MAKYPQGANNRWHKPVKKDYKWGYCDCGLIHDVDFKALDKNGKEIKGAIVLIRVRRNNRSTAMMRRHKGVKIDVQYETVEAVKGGKY